MVVLGPPHTNLTHRTFGVELLAKPEWQSKIAYIASSNISFDHCLCLRLDAPVEKLKPLFLEEQLN